MSVSIIVPIYNEAANLEELYRRLAVVFERIDDDAELILVNDGSTDGSLSVMEKLLAADSRLRIIDLSRNFGHQAAISAGLEHCSGDAAITMDGDLQDPPELIPALLAKWREGFEVVYTIRTKRKDPWHKRLASASFYRLLRLLSDTEIPLDSGDFSLIDRKVLNHLLALPERNYFLRGLRSWVGHRQTGLDYERDKRYAGGTKYSFSRRLKLACDGLSAFSSAPLHLAGGLGLLAIMLAFAGTGFWFVKFIIRNEITVFPSIIVSVLFLGGVQLLMIGILGEYIGRIYGELKGRPRYLVREQYGFDRKIKDDSLSSHRMTFH